MNIVVGQKFRVKEWSELLLRPDARIAEQINPGSIFLLGSGGAGCFSSDHERYCGRILTVENASWHTHSWDDNLSRFLAKETGNLLWRPWMVELVKDACSVDEKSVSKLFDVIRRYEDEFIEEY
mgnify:CR=1 FL=1